MSLNVSKDPTFPQQRSGPPGAPPRLWEHFTSHALPSEATPMICRGNEIIYACLNMIRTWNYKSNEEKIRFFSMQKEDSITALAELPTKSLICGSESGYIFVEKNGSWANFRFGESCVDEISILGPGYVIVKFRDKKKTLISTENGNKLRDFDVSAEVCRYKENIFASVKDGNVEVVKVDTLEKTPLFNKRFNQKFSSIRSELEQFLLLKHVDKKGFTIWCVEKNEVSRARLHPRIWTDQFQNLMLIDENTFLIPEFEFSTRRMQLTKYSHDELKNEWTPCANTCAGYGRVLSMIRADSHIIYGKRKIGKSCPSGIHFFNTNCELLYSDSECTDKGVSDPLALVPLKNGYLVIRLSDSVRIIKKKKYPKYKSRLFVGEGDFSYTEALLRKHEVRHPELGAAITATELNAVDDFLEERMEHLNNRQVEIKFGIDARKIHHYFHRFKRIHWNCPYGRKSSAKNVGFANVIREFFKSCAENQNLGDRVHITLMQEKYNDYWKRFRQQEHPIVSASSYAGYRLIKKRLFGKGRYPGYEHWKTSGEDRHYSSNDEDMREFIFEKIDFGVEYTADKLHGIKKYRPRDCEYYFDCSTDCDSTSYEDSTSDEDNETMNGNSEEREFERYHFGRNCKMRPDSSPSLTEENMRTPPGPVPPQKHTSHLPVSSNIAMRPSSKPISTEGHASNSTLSSDNGNTLSPTGTLKEEHMSNSTPSSSNEWGPSPNQTSTGKFIRNPTPSPNVEMRPSPSPPAEGEKSNSAAGSSTQMRPIPNQTSTGKSICKPTPSQSFESRPSPAQTTFERCLNVPHLINRRTRIGPSPTSTSQYFRGPRGPYGMHSRQSTTNHRRTSRSDAPPNFGATCLDVPQQDTRPVPEPEVIILDSPPVSEQSRLH